MKHINKTIILEFETCIVLRTQCIQPYPSHQLTYASSPEYPTQIPSLPLFMNTPYPYPPTEERGKIDPNPKPPRYAIDRRKKISSCVLRIFFKIIENVYPDRHPDKTQTKYGPEMPIGKN